MTRAKRGPYERKQPKQQPLPGTQSARNRVLETNARDYVALADDLAAIRKRKAKTEADLVANMHKAGLTTYARNGVTVTLIPETETVKVKYRKPETRRDLGDDTEAVEALNSVSVSVE